MRKHRSAGGCIKLMDCQHGIKSEDAQVLNSQYVPHGEAIGTYATNRHTRRMLKKVHGITAKRLCDLNEGKA